MQNICLVLELEIRRVVEQGCQIAAESKKRRES